MKSTIRTFAAVLIVLGGLSIPSVRGQGLFDSVSLVGTWKVTVSPNGIPPFRAYNVFLADGNSFEYDSSNPPSLQTIASGPWARTGRNTFVMTEVNQLFDPQGTYQGELIVTATITLSDSGSTFTSKFQFTVTDPNDHAVFQGTGTAKGERVGLKH